MLPLTISSYLVSFTKNQEVLTFTDWFLRPLLSNVSSQTHTRTSAEARANHSSTPSIIPSISAGILSHQWFFICFFLLLLVFSPTGSISNIDGAEYHCNKTQVRKVISGVVGAASSVTSIQVANLLRLFRIPQVSTVYFSNELERAESQKHLYMRIAQVDLNTQRMICSQSWVGTKSTQQKQKNKNKNSQSKKWKHQKTRKHSAQIPSFMKHA